MLTVDRLISLLTFLSWKLDLDYRASQIIFQQWTFFWESFKKRTIYVAQAHPFKCNHLLKTFILRMAALLWLNSLDLLKASIRQLIYLWRSTHSSVLDLELPFYYKCISCIASSVAFRNLNYHYQWIKIEIQERHSTLMKAGKTANL